MMVCKFRVKYLINQGCTVATSCQRGPSWAWVEALGEAGADSCWPWLLLHPRHRTESISNAGRCWHLTLPSSKVSGVAIGRWTDPLGLMMQGSGMVEVNTFLQGLGQWRRPWSSDGLCARVAVYLGVRMFV